MTELMVAIGEFFRNPQAYPKIQKTIGYGAMAGEAALNPSSVFRTLSRSAKANVTKALSQMKGSGKSTSAIDMAYGKRRNYRGKRSYRKRIVKRRKSRRKSVSKRAKGAGTLAVLKKALSGSMSY